MTRKMRMAAMLAAVGMGFGAVALASGQVSPPAHETARKPQDATPKAGGSNRGYVVGKGGVARQGGSNRGYVVGDGGVARLQDSPASGQTAEIGINEPGVNRKAKGETPPRESATPGPKPPRGD